MFKTIYEKVTGRPYLTVRSMAAEFGPTPASRYPELARYSDAELLAHGPQLLARARAADRQALLDSLRARARDAELREAYEHHPELVRSQPS